MAISDRKEREKEERRRLIIDTATKLFREHGFEKVSLRNIADQIEYSPTMIYLYFKDKNELLHALHTEGFRMLKQRFDAALASLSDPWERFKVLGETYVRFGLENPEYYELMFMSGEPMQTEMTEDAWNEGLLSHACLESEVKNCIASGYFPGHEFRILSFTVWCFVHGMVSLAIKDRLKMYEEEERESLLQRTMEIMMSFLEKK
ncbi:MAG: TetR/AcrR family transcriptional regulator [Microscillaceae bacterium]|nr:TetR/AcrR family transcriptional regulator [Microscillaceae bacterium]